MIRCRENLKSEYILGLAILNCREKDNKWKEDEDL